MFCFIYVSYVHFGSNIYCNVYSGHSTVIPPVYSGHPTVIPPVYSGHSTVIPPVYSGNSTSFQVRGDNPKVLGGSRGA